MPVGHDGRASRRPLPRQLDMSSWSVDSSSTTQDGDRLRNAPGGSRQTNDFNYGKTREPPNRFEAFREDEYRPREASTREESQHAYEGRGVRTSEYDVGCFSSERSTIGGSTIDATFPSMGSSRELQRVGSSRATYRSDQGSRHDNQREVDDFSRYGGSTTWNRQDEPWRSDRSSRSNFRPTSERGETHYTESPTFTRAPESLPLSTSFGYRRPDNYSRLDDDKTDSIREAESPVTTARPSNRYKYEGKDSSCKAPTSTLASSLGNQDEPCSPTNSETSIAPNSPDSDCDSVAQRIRDRYPRPSIPSPVSSDRSSSRRMRPSSPCSSVSTSRTSIMDSRGSTTRTKQLENPQRMAESPMTDLREELYAFRKQMRDVFIRVEDMVDVHRSFFKSDPSTGIPVFNGELQQEAEQLANEAFEQLAGLRKHFTRLAQDFQRSEQPPEEGADRERKGRSGTKAVSVPPKRARQLATSSQASHDGNTSLKVSDMVEDDGSDAPERLSVGSGNDDASSSREHSPSIRGGRYADHVDNSDDDDQNSIIPESVRSTMSSLQLQSRWRKNSGVDSIAMSDISARTRTRGRSPSIVSDVSSLPDQCSKASEPDTQSIFKDFDKRMEEIRCSLNAIASGQKLQCSVSVAAPPKMSTQRGGAGSPIRVMMDPARTRSTLREASRISRRLDDGEGDNDSSEPARTGGREAELRQLLQELNHINAANDDDDN